MLDKGIRIITTSLICMLLSLIIKWVGFMPVISGFSHYRVTLLWSNKGFDQNGLYVDNDELINEQSKEMEKLVISEFE